MDVNMICSAHAVLSAAIKITISPTQAQCEQFARVAMERTPRRAQCVVDRWPPALPLTTRAKMAAVECSSTRTVVCRINRHLFFVVLLCSHRFSLSPFFCAFGQSVRSLALRSLSSVLLLISSSTEVKKERSCTSSHPNAPLWSVTGPLYFLFVTADGAANISAPELNCRLLFCTALSCSSDLGLI
jgi:hypothetical protein